MPHGGERKLLDDSDQPPQPASNHPQHFQWNFWMLQAKRAELLLTDEEQRRRGDGLSRGGITPAIEDRYLSDRTARSVDGEHLLAASGGTLEDSDMSRFNNIQPK